MTPPTAVQVCAEEARATLEIMRELCADDPASRARLRYLGRWRARLMRLGDANGLCALFDEILFDYDEEDPRTIVGWRIH